MPGIDGLEMIRRVKDAAPETRFIVLSCMNDIQRYKEAVSLGAAEYLQKDLATPDVLLETVRRVAQQLKRERLRNSDGEAHADTAPQLRTEYLNLLLSGTAENLRTAPYQLEKWGLLKRGAPFTVGRLRFRCRIPAASARSRPMPVSSPSRRRSSAVRVPAVSSVQRDGILPRACLRFRLSGWRRLSHVCKAWRKAALTAF